MPDTTINLPGEPLPSEPRSLRRAEQLEGLSSDAIALYIGGDETPIIIQLPLRERAHVGRYIAAFSAQPLIDLTPYEAFEKGVSRMHAAIQRTEDGTLVVEDLDSSNGTYLNGKRLLPHTAVALTSGDILRLSNLPIQVFFRSALHQPSPDTTSTEPVSAQEPSSEISTPIGLLAAVDGKLIERPVVSPPTDRLPKTKQLSSTDADSSGIEPRLVLKGHVGAVQAMAFSPDGQYLASAGADGVVRVWATTTGNIVGVLKGHIGAVYSLMFSPDGKQLASAGTDGTVYLWDVAALLA
ncbi:MAG: FHA domain-containing protein [Anaerolineae bacterium]|nr:FHA domain-containing protein [Anaerolineae bacterium]